MTYRKATALALTAWILASCSHEQTLDTVQPQATQVAQRRAQTDLQCPTVTTQIASRKLIEPPPTYSLGTDRLEYTISASGCGKSGSYLVACVQDGSGCYIPAPGAAVKP
jgi:hypothetical protein